MMNNPTHILWVGEYYRIRAKAYPNYIQICNGIYTNIIHENVSDIQTAIDYILSFNEKTALKVVIHGSLIPRDSSVSDESSKKIRRTIWNCIIAFPEVVFFVHDGSDWLERVFNIPEDISNLPGHSINEVIKALRFFESCLRKKKKVCDFVTDIEDDQIRHRIKIIQKKIKEKGRIEAIEYIHNTINKYRCQITKNTAAANFLCIDDPEKDLKRIVLYDNLYDASNIRYLAKMFKFDDLKVRINHQNTLNSRSENLATILDEEYLMAQRISYSLYASGYRALYISSFELFNTVRKDITSQSGILIRDFDLQFADAPSSPTVGINNVDYIRGFKLGKLMNGQKKNIILDWFLKSNKETWEALYDSSNTDIIDFWKGFRFTAHKQEYMMPSIYCISHGYPQLYINPSKKQKGWTITRHNRRLNAPGVKKPLLGIYQSINSSIEETNLKVKNLRRKLPEVKTSRISHNHSIPLDLYSIVVPMLERAEKYFKEERFILSAVLSQECIEMLNGMHVSLGHRAYLVHAKSENAIAMNEIGGDESVLADDCRTRIRYVIADIERLDKPYDNDGKNILNQIFSDCRQYCHEKEHFKSEEAFISALATLNDGSPIKDSWRKIKNRLVK